MIEIKKQKYRVTVSIFSDAESEEEAVDRVYDMMKGDIDMTNNWRIDTVFLG